MSKYGLSFISDNDLFEHVKKTVNAYSFAIDLAKFNKNLIDPIKLTFDSVVYNQSIQDTIEYEVIRQLDKTNSNLIGYFHQDIFKYISKDWTVPTSGFDIINQKEKIFVEMKNKHNTMNSSSGAKTFMKFQSTLLKDNDASCYLVEIIAKKSQNITWVITLDGERQTSNVRIRRVSIDKFYEIVTGDNKAFRDLCSALPKVIRDVVESGEIRDRKNTVFEELNKISTDLLTSIFLLSFSSYEGFKDLKFK